MAAPTSYEERYALELIANGARLLGGQMEIQQALDEDGFHAQRIVVHLPKEKHNSSAPYTNA